MVAEALWGDSVLHNNCLFRNMKNIKNAKATTRQLEMENQRMEERLQELRLAMNREKEERE